MNVALVDVVDQGVTVRARIVVVIKVRARRVVRLANLLLNSEVASGVGVVLPLVKGLVWRKADNNDTIMQLPNPECH